MVEGFLCPTDTRGYVVWGFLSPGRVSQWKLVLGDGPDKDQLKKKPYEQKIEGNIYPVQDRVNQDPALEPAPGRVSEGERLMAGP